MLNYIANSANISRHKLVQREGAKEANSVYCNFAGQYFYFCRAIKDYYTILELLYNHSNLPATCLYFSFVNSHIKVNPRCCIRPFENLEVYKRL